MCCSTCNVALGLSVEQRTCFVFELGREEFSEDDLVLFFSYFRIIVFTPALSKQVSCVSFPAGGMLPASVTLYVLTVEFSSDGMLCYNGHSVTQNGQNGGTHNTEFNTRNFVKKSFITQYFRTNF